MSLADRLSPEQGGARGRVGTPISPTPRRSPPLLACPASATIRVSRVRAAFAGNSGPSLRPSAERRTQRARLGPRVRSCQADPSDELTRPRDFYRVVALARTACREANRRGRSSHDRSSRKARVCNAGDALDRAPVRICKMASRGATARSCLSSIGEESGGLGLVPAPTMRATAAECLLPVGSQALRKHRRDRGVGVGVAPDFMTKRNSELVGIGDGAPPTAERLEYELECGAEPTS
jgi:hypothetical protein